jgi:Arc/MetJ-type ribon-helix-helix transcriptional regulator
MIQLSPEVQKRIEERMQQGDFRSADDLVRAALDSLDDPIDGEIGAETQAALDRADEEINQGKVRDWAEVSAELRQRYLKK